MSVAKVITHVIFDMDGVLLDTEPFYTEATQIIASRFGKVFDWSLKGKMIGKKASDSAAIFVESLGLPMTPGEYLEARKPILEDLFPRAQPLPGALRLTRHLSRLGIPIAVATSSDSRHYEMKTMRHREWFASFDCCVLGNDPALRHGKPAPDIFLIAAERMGADPAHCLVFEDSPAGVQAARSAGMSVVAVPDPNMSRAGLADADQILDSLELFDPASWHLPPFPENPEEEV